MRKYAAEMFGTFALVFAGTGAVVIDNVTAGAVTQVGIAWTFGLIVMAMIFAVGDVSGAHLNPAVTIGFFVSGRLRLRFILPYIASQLGGAFAASSSCCFCSAITLRWVPRSLRGLRGSRSGSKWS